MPRSSIKNICTIHDVGVASEGTPFLGADLHRAKRDTESMPSASVARPSAARTLRRALSLAAAGVALAASVVGGYLYLHRSPKLTDKDTLVIADFANRTGDPVFDDTLRQGLAVQLERAAETREG